MSTLSFIDLIDTNQRKSSLAITGAPHYSAPGYFKVIGNLEHGADVKPATRADAIRLAAFILGESAALTDDQERALGEELVATFIPQRSEEHPDRYMLGNGHNDKTVLGIARTVLGICRKHGAAIIGEEAAK